MDQVEPDEDTPSLVQSIESTSDTTSTTTTFTNLPALCSIPRQRLCISGDRITPFPYGLQDSPQNLLRQLPGTHLTTDDLVVSYYPTIDYVETKLAFLFSTGILSASSSPQRSRSNSIISILSTDDDVFQFPTYPTTDESPE